MRVLHIFALIAALMLAGCKVSADSSQKDLKPTVLVSILPQKYMVEKIANDTVNVKVLLPPGAFPATFEPTPKNFADISDAKLYFMVGHPKFALEVNWAKKIIDANKDLKQVKLSDASGNLSEELDPHIWLSPTIVKNSIKALAEKLSELLPENKDSYLKNSENFIAEIENSEKSIIEKFKNKKNNKFLVLHPAWGYFAKEFELEQLAIEEHGHETGNHSVMEIVELAKTNKINTVYVQKQYAGKEADTVAREIDGQVLRIDPLAENWLENLEQVADTLSRNMK